MIFMLFIVGTKLITLIILISDMLLVNVHLVNVHHIMFFCHHSYKGRISA
jgi:hypothetical protein